MVQIKLHHSLSGTKSEKTEAAKLSTQLSEKYGTRYIWDKAYFSSASENMKVLCRTHGFFKETPKTLVSKYTKQPCPKCTLELERRTAKLVHKKVTYDFTMFQKEAAANHPELILRTKFKGFNYPIIADCATHGHFKIKNPATLFNPNTTLCAACRAEKGRITTEQFVAKASKLHDNRYSYKNTVYQGARNKLLVTCPTHGDFSVVASDHYLNGNGCGKCHRGGFRTTLPGTLYYLSIDNGSAYKIGITNGSVKTRFTSADLKRIKLLKTWHYQSGDECRKKERYILEKYKFAKYRGDKLLESVGTSELFNQDILLLDKD